MKLRGYLAGWTLVGLIALLFTLCAAPPVEGEPPRSGGGGYPIPHVEDVGWCGEPPPPLEVEEGGCDCGVQ